eukprot:gene43922-53700_t
MCGRALGIATWKDATAGSAASRGSSFEAPVLGSGMQETHLLEGLAVAGDELRGQVEDVSNRVDQTNDRAQKAEKRQGDLYNDTDARMRRLEQLAKDEATERKKVVQQITDMELRLKKFEADLEVQIRKLEADHEARFRKLEAASTATSGDFDTRLKRLEQPAGPSKLE